MVNSGFGGNGDFQALARQYWSAWGEAMRQGASGSGQIYPQGSPDWQQAVRWWSQLMPSGPSPANDAVGRFNQQARDWFGQMQQVAARFAGQDSSPADVSQAWRQAMGASGENPFLDLFKGMRGPGLHGLDEWLEQAQPYVDALQQQGQRWQQLPAFGQYREHQERWQALQQAQQEYQHQTGEYNKLVMQCLQSAMEVFEDKLAAHEEPGRQIGSARALFDLWIDAAEEAYGRVALSPEFRQTYGALTNAQMRLRAGIQGEVEQISGLFGMPTRTEIDSAHRKINQLERALRKAAAGASVAARPSRPAPVQARSSAAESSPKAMSRARPKVGKGTSVSKPRAAKVKPPLKAAKRKSAVTRKTAAAPPAAGKSAAKLKPRKTKTAAKPKTAKAVKRRTPAASSKQPAPKQSVAAAQAGRVVSMKDWVARYAAGNTVAQSPDGKRSSKKKARK